MKATATLRVGLADAAVGRALSEVLAPDNEGLPKGMRLSTATRGNLLECAVSSPSPAASISTVLAILRDIALFQEVWLLSSRRGGRAQGPDLG